MKQRTPPFWLRWLHARFAEWLEQYEQARAWSARHCPCCAAPVSSDDARYCAMCGQCLLVEARVTDALPVARTWSGDLGRMRRDADGHIPGPETMKHRAYVRAPRLRP